MKYGKIKQLLIAEKQQSCLIRTLSYVNHIITHMVTL